MGQYVKVFVNNVAISEGDNSNPLSTKVNYETKPESDVIQATIRIPDGYEIDMGLTVFLPYGLPVANAKIGDKTIMVAQVFFTAGMKIVIGDSEYTIASVDMENSIITLTEGLKKEANAFVDFYVKDYDCWAFSKDGVNWAKWGECVSYDPGFKGDLKLYIKARAKSTETAEIKKDCKIALSVYLKSI